MAKELKLHPDRLFSPQRNIRQIAKSLYKEIMDLPIISPHGHTDPAWFSTNEPFNDATSLIVKPDHYVFRMLYSQGISLDQLGLATVDGQIAERDNRKIWRLFAANYHLFRGTPSRMWLDSVFFDVFSIDKILCPETADYYYNTINGRLSTDDFKPRNLFERFNIEVLATTEGANDTLEHHKKIQESGWQGRVISTYRPDAVIDPDYEDFASSVARFGEVTGEDTTSYQGYLTAHKIRRQYFMDMGATATDHGHPTAKTLNLSTQEAEQLYLKAVRGSCSPEEAETFRAHMLVKMAEMSLEDGLVMQLHAGPRRNHNKMIFERYGRDKGADVPTSMNFVEQLKPLLDLYGNNPDFTLILFTLDESNYARELAPLAGHYPCLKLGPPWWFHDSPEGMRRYRQQTTETAGFYNTAGFNDDTRAFMSIPARHDVARRMDCNWLAELVADHRIDIDEAHELAIDLTYNLAKKAYKL